MTTTAPPLPSQVASCILLLALTLLTPSVAAFTPSAPYAAATLRRCEIIGGISTTRTTTPVASTTTALRVAILSDLIQEYQTISSAFPLETQSATFGTFAGVGDALAQNKDAESRRASYDAARTARLVVKGLGAGLIWSAWYPAADVWSADITATLLGRAGIPDEGAVHAAMQTITSIVLEEGVACPIVFSLWDVPLPALLSGESPRSIPGIVKEKVPGLLLENAKVWSVANIVVYNLPVNWRIFAVSVAEIFWATLFSSVTNASSGGSNDEKGRSSQEAPMKESVESAIGVPGPAAAAGATNKEMGDEILAKIESEKREKVEAAATALASGGIGADEMARTPE